MRTLAKFPCLLLLLLPVIAVWVFPAIVSALPKEKKTATETKPLPQQSVNPQSVNPPRPIRPLYGRTERLNPKYKAPSSAHAFPYLGPTRVDQAASPYVDVRVGTPEVISNNHMRRQLAVSASGVVHMVYEVYKSDSDWVVRNPADSNINGIYFYNAYDCGGSNGLRHGSLDVEMAQVFPGIGDDRPRKLTGAGGIMVPNTASGVPVIYGNRAILRTDLPGAGRFDWRQGWGTMKDSSECRGLFSMDTSYTDRNVNDPVMHAINESTYVATFADAASHNIIRFSYTTDRGKSWAPMVNAPTYSPWWNSVDITSQGNTFYIVSMTDPEQVSAFGTTERPVYLKGTYNPATGAITFGTLTDITGDFELPIYLANMADISALMLGDTLHVLWTDWNRGSYLPFPGGHVHHAAVLPDGAVQGPHKIADINITGEDPARSNCYYSTLLGFGCIANLMVSLSYDSSRGLLFALWSQPPDNGSFGWADYEATGTMSCYDIFLSVSSNAGRGWDMPVNVTQTNNPGCDGSPADPCHHENYFKTAALVADTIWTVATVQRYPGIQESAERGGIQPDVGPFTEHYDVFRLYKIPARAPLFSARGALGSVPGDTANPYALNLKAGGTPFTLTLRLSNIGILGFVTDSIKISSWLNDGFLATTSDWASGVSVSVGDHYDFHVTLDPYAVTPSAIGGRAGNILVYVHSVSPASSQQIGQGIQAFVLPTQCLNRSQKIHSAKNRSDVWSQGALVNEGGEGLHEGPPSPGGIDRFYDGGVWIANSALNAAAGVPNVPRKVTRQLFNDEFLRCVADGVLDSVPGTGGGYYNLVVKSIATDIEDTTLVWQNIWEQSTHPDSSDFLLQTTRVINIGNNPIDSVALGVCYDIDVYSAISHPGRNVSGDTFVTYSGRKFWLGWTAGPDVTIDSCSPNNEFYGVIGIPGSIGISGDSIHPRGTVMYDQRGFAYNVDNGIAAGGDSSAQRMMYNLNVCTSTRRRTHDSLTGVWMDTAQGPFFNRHPGTYFICGGAADPLNYQKYGAPRWRDQGYLSVAKKVYNFPVNSGGAGMAARYGLDGLAAGVDSAFQGPGETYTYIHLASATGLAGLMANGVKGIDWYVKHANLQTGPYQSVMLRNDYDNNGQPNPADVMGELNKVFLNTGATSDCVADLDLNGSLTPSDVVLSLTSVFLGTGCPWCYTRCP